MNTVLYCLKQGFSNLRKNILFSSASAATIAACIFLFCLFYSIVMNVQHIAWQAETTIGITVFFREDATMTEKEAFRDAVEAHGGVKDIVQILLYVLIFDLYLGIELSSEHIAF